MPKTHYVFLLEQLQPHRKEHGKSDVHFHWDDALQTWRVTWNGSQANEIVAAVLIAAAEALGMISPKRERKHIYEHDIER